jgi:redox-sensitive bicupin YhaK (pirin superfamily)
MDGWIDHADSLGNAGRYGEGDVQWLTAGKGICHSEMFPLINTTSDNTLRFFQIWLNLPSYEKMADPFFTMLWHNTISTIATTTKRADGSTSSHARVTLWAGDEYYYNVAGEDSSLTTIATNADHPSTSLPPPPPPPPNSWANDPDHDVVILYVTMEPGSRLVLPKAKNAKVNRSLFYVEGDAGVVKVDGTSIESRVVLTLDPKRSVTLDYDTAAEPTSTNKPSVAEFLLLQGQPIQEPVAQHGPFVMNTQSEIQQAFSDYAKTQFGGWPWPRDDMVFPSTKGRFALVDGHETTDVPTSESSNKDICSQGAVQE